jgi:uroporphyrin-III C-methyltransferase
LRDSRHKRNESLGTLELPELLPGWVWLTGAGPGDPGLLTLHAWNALQQAEVVVYDALVDESILQLAPPQAELEYAGKRGGKPSPRQADISHRLIQLARRKKRVVRLKGGDPFVFGRGGEEALNLVEAGVPFRIIPGVTAGIGGLAYAGIPVTHRDTNSAVTFLTGHGTTGLVPERHDWEGLAKGSPVLVIYMAMKHLANIAEQLMSHGRSPQEPVAIVAHACTPHQQVLETRLGECVAAAQEAALEPPALVVVGEVVRFRESLDWLGALEGRILTRDPLGTRQLSETG